MLIKYEKEINNCYECPFKERVYEHGFSGTLCHFKLGYETIPKHGIFDDCIFKQGELKDETRNRTETSKH